MVFSGPRTLRQRDLTAAVKAVVTARRGVARVDVGKIIFVTKPEQRFNKVAGESL